MSASTGGAIKALIEGADLGLAGYRDEAPPQASLPHCVIFEDITTTLHDVDNPHDRGASGTDKHVLIETVQVELRQAWRDPPKGPVTESASLVDSLLRTLDGASLATAPTRVWSVLVTSRLRLLDKNANTVRHVFTLDVLRDDG